MKKGKQKFNIIFIVIIIILLLIIAFLLGKSSTFSSSKLGVGKAGISLEEFQKIDYGDSEMDVYKIIDPDDLLDEDDTYNKVVSEISKTKNEHIYTYTQKYMGEKNGYAEITYTADYSNGEFFVIPTVTNKINHDLK